MDKTDKQALVLTLVIGAGILVGLHSTPEQKSSEKTQVVQHSSSATEHSSNSSSAAEQKTNDDKTVNVPTEPKRDVNADLQSAWSRISPDAVKNAQIAVYDHKTNQTYTFTHGEPNNYPTASIVKVSVLAQRLSIDELNDHERQLASDMIQKSDNDATTEMVTSLGGVSTFPQFFDKMSMSNSGVGDTWGTTLTTASDQLSLLNDIFYNHKVLSEQQGQYISDLMSHVEDNQNWGVSSGCDKSNVQLKNGWLPLENNYRNAIVNSIGHINDNDTDYTIAILTNGDTTQDDGIDYVNELAQATHDTLKQDQ